MEHENKEDLANYRIEKAEETLKTAEFILKEVKDYTSANNRAYYAIFYTIRAVLALEEVDFKRHKDVIAYFNQHYINTGIFPKKIGKKIAQAQRVREDSDYDDKYEPSPIKTEEQIETAKELLNLVERYLSKINRYEETP